MIPATAELDRQLYAAITAELGQRRTSRFAYYARWRTDPVGFIRDGLLGHPWSKQIEIAESVLRNRRTAVQSCHDVGKDWIAARIVAWWLSCHNPGDAFAVTIAPTAHQVKAILWREIQRAHAAGSLPGELNLTEWWHGPELVAYGRSPADNNPTAIQGIHARKVLVVHDEACGISKAIMDSADSMIANDESRVLAIGNPDDPVSEFGRICQPGSGWNVIAISAFESPNFTGEPIPEGIRPLLVSKTWVEEKRKSWGEGSPLWVSKVLGKFPELADDGLIPVSALRAAHDRWTEGVTVGRGQIHMGVDVARMGKDRTVFYCYDTAAHAAWKVHQHVKRDLMELVGEVIRCVRKHKVNVVRIDDAGMGGGVSDRLAEIKRTKEAGGALDHVQIIPVNVGDGASPGLNDERFKNKRAEMNWKVRELFTSDTAMLAVEPNDELDAQATQIKYKVLSTGEIQIEAKADMKKRTAKSGVGDIAGGLSPDDWDAFVLAVVSDVRKPTGGIKGFGV